MIATYPQAISAGVSAPKQGSAVFPAIVGFFFVFRVSLIYLLFQASPETGTIVSLAINLALLFCAFLYSASDGGLVGSVPFTSVMRWMLLMFSFCAVSLCWTGEQSLVAALGYFTAITTDVAIAILLLRNDDRLNSAESLMKGVVWGAVALAIVAWCSPATADLRLGNDEFLHPNTLGLELGIATLIAQYLMGRGPLWKGLCFLLAVTLIRTFSKTAILAFFFAECSYLTQSRILSRRAKLQIAGVALLVVASFWGIFNSYLTVYNTTGSGNQAETLTGRTVLWTVALSMGLEKPWLGHGFYSFKSLIPALGPFAAVHAHNELLQQFFEFGLVGVATAIALYFSFAKQMRRAEASELRTLGLALLIFSLVRGLGDTVPIGLSYPLWLMAVISVCVASSPAPGQVAE